MQILTFQVRPFATFVTLHVSRTCSKSIRHHELITTGHRICYGMRLAVFLEDLFGYQMSADG